MNAEEHPDYPRVMKVVEQFFERMEEVERQYDCQIALDDFGLIAIPVVREGEDHETVSETVMGVFSTQRGHAQIGLLEIAAANAKSEFLVQANDDDD